jgi:hypothetical protein
MGHSTMYIFLSGSEVGTEEIKQNSSNHCQEHGLLPFYPLYSLLIMWYYRLQFPSMVAILRGIF